MNTSSGDDDDGLVCWRRSERASPRQAAYNSGRPLESNAMDTSKSGMEASNRFWMDWADACNSATTASAGRALEAYSVHCTSADGLVPLLPLESSTTEGSSAPPDWMERMMASPSCSTAAAAAAASASVLVMLAMVCLDLQICGAANPPSPAVSGFLCFS